MKKEYLQLLRNMFGNSGDIVWITDENWNIQWEKYASGKIPNLPEMLNVPKDLWEDASAQVFLYESFYDCTIHCSKENRCRVIILKQIVPSQGMPEDIPLNAAVHSLRQVKRGFEEYFEENNLDEKKDLLDSIERNCILLYRKPFIKRILNSVRSRTASRMLFAVQDILREMQKDMRSELGIYAETVFSLPEKEVYLMEHEPFFRVVVLAGLTLCHQEHGYFHQAAFSLGVSGTKAELIINLTPDYQRPLNMSKQLDPQNFGAYDEEKQALEIFCMMHQGSWKMMNYTEGEKLISSCCQICFHTDEFHPEIIISSPRRSLRSDYDDVCRMMLSRIYLSSFEEG